MAKSKQFRRSRKQQGGAGAADHVIGVVGGIGQQTALAGSNVIAMKDLTTPTLVAETKGGALVALTPAAIETVQVKGGASLPLALQTSIQKTFIQSQKTPIQSQKTLNAYTFAHGKNIYIIYKKYNV